MNINGINQNYIDTANANNVSKALFNALQNKSVDYSKGDIKGFNRRTLGLDLYSTKTDLNVQRQIALTNAGLVYGQMNLTSVNALNTMAAQASYAANVISTSENEVSEGSAYSQVEEIANSISTFGTSADKKDSNPFSFGNFFNTEDKEA